MADQTLTAPRKRLRRITPKRARPRVPRGTLRVAATALLAGAVLAGSWTALRHSPLAAVRDVTVTGLTTTQGPQVREALEAAAQGMSTLGVREDALQAAVAPFASVAGLDVRADFPHELRIHVHERAPVAVLREGSRRVPVAADGRLLPGVRPDTPLPAIEGPSVTGGHVADAGTRGLVSILAAAPPELRERAGRALADRRGIVVELIAGPELIFGSAERPRAKWAAATRVLAEPSAAGAVYLDVRVPERPAAGGLAPVDPTVLDSGAVTAPADPAGSTVQTAVATLDSQVDVEP